MAPRNSRKEAAETIFLLQMNTERYPKAYNTIYRRLIWNQLTISYVYYGDNDTYSYSTVSNI